MPASPKISVCIPTYNYADYLPLAIQSVLEQSFTDFELIVQDDCSTDGTAEAVRPFLSDGRVSFGVNEFNLGLAGNWNLCMEKARGEYIKFVFADDLLPSPDALGKMACVLDADPSVSLVASARNIIDSESRLTRILCEFNGSFTARGTEIIRRCLFRQANLIGEPTAVMFRRTDALRGFNPNYGQLIDLEMWFHLLEKGKFAFIDEPLAAFRIHPRQKTAENIGSMIHFDETLSLVKDYLARPHLDAWPPVRYYLTVDAVYQFWKSRKKGLVDRKGALKRIGARFSVPEFFLVLPFYKLVKPFVKLHKKLNPMNFDHIPCQK